MNNDYPFFKYIVGTSPLHMMNSKYKILSFLLTLLAIIVLNSYSSFLVIFLFIIYLISKTGINIFVYIKNVIFLWPLYLTLFIASYFLSLNINLCLLLILKVILVEIVFLILMFTTSLSEIAWGFECLFEKLKKYHIPVCKISLKIAFYLKFISTLLEQFKVIRKSMAYRGVAYKKTNILKTIKLMIIPSIVLSYKLSLRMVSVMKLRFYGVSKNRSNYRENKEKKYDKFLIFINILVIYIIIWLGWIK